MRYLAVYLYFYLGQGFKKLAQLCPGLKFAKTVSNHCMSISKDLDEYNLIGEHNWQPQKKNKN